MSMHDVSETPRNWSLDDWNLRSDWIGTRRCNESVRENAVDQMVGVGEAVYLLIQMVKGSPSINSYLTAYSRVNSLLM
jgi:hypothetical protein